MNLTLIWHARIFQMEAVYEGARVAGGVLLEPPHERSGTRLSSLRDSVLADSRAVIAGVASVLEGSLWAWGFVAAVAVVDWCWVVHKGWSFSGWPGVLTSLAILLTVAFVYGTSGRNHGLAEAGNYAALWIAFALAGAVFTYLTAALNMPLQDAALFRIDAAMGFDWFAWSHWLTAHTAFRTVLELVYQTFVPQIIGSVLYFAHIGRSDRNRELLWAGMISLMITAAMAGVLPALGPFLAGAPPPWTIALIAVRDRAVSRFVFGDMQGVIAMPSFHAVIAILLIYTHRGLVRSFYPMVLLNFLMLLSAPSQGHHFLIDVIAGIAVAVLTISVLRLVIKPGEVSSRPSVRSADTSMSKTCYNPASDA